MDRVARIAASALGRALNALHIPCFLKHGDYHSKSGVRVEVRCGNLLSVVSVNGIDVYFDRITGRIDGVGSRDVSDYKSASAAE
jgi:hypothetical protein